jgi:hypothetical protein
MLHKASFDLKDSRAIFLILILSVAKEGNEAKIIDDIQASTVMAGLILEFSKYRDVSFGL